MQKIVVGIIAMFFVQVGFQVYSAIGTTNYAYRSLSTEIPAEALPQGVAAAIDELYLASFRPADISPPRPERSELKVLSQREPDRSQTSRRAMQAIATRRAPAYTETAIGKDVIITIPSPSAPSYRSVDLTASAAPQREKKRGFFSKSLRVLKKPYDWMKTVAMKLD